MFDELVKKFWEYINNAEFGRLDEIMEPTAKVILPNTREMFLCCKDYIDFNEDYPGRWFADIERLIDAGNEIVTAARIYNDEGTSLYVTSFFTLKNGLIGEITEYWGENGEVPKWRKDKNYSHPY